MPVLVSLTEINTAAISSVCQSSEDLHTAQPKPSVDNLLILFALLSFPHKARLKICHHIRLLENYCFQMLGTKKSEFNLHGKIKPEKIYEVLFNFIKPSAE